MLITKTTCTGCRQKGMEYWYLVSLTLASDREGMFGMWVQSTPVTGFRQRGYVWNGGTEYPFHWLQTDRVYMYGMLVQSTPFTGFRQWVCMEWGYSVPLTLLNS